MQFQQAKDFIVKKLSDELPDRLSYHSIEHINDVYAACEHTAKNEGVEGEELVLLLTAALYHDSGFLVQSKDHEKLSCDLVKACLPGFQYTPEQVAVICGMIMATKLPQSPKNKLEEILCDADLDYLGRDDFYHVGNRLFREFSMEGIVNDERDWNHVQLKFLAVGDAINVIYDKKDPKIAERYYLWYWFNFPLIINVILIALVPFGIIWGLKAIFKTKTIVLPSNRPL